MTDRKGVTLVELLLVVFIIGAMLFVAIPRLSRATITGGKVQTTAQKISSAIRYARSLAISNAATNTQGYALNMTGSGNYTGFEIVDLSNSDVVQSESIDSEVACRGANDFRFSPLGNRLVDTDSLTVSGSGKTYSITVTSATGMVRCEQQ